MTASVQSDCEPGYLPDWLHHLFVDTPEAVHPEVGFCQRRRLLDPSSFVRILVFGWLHDPEALLPDLARYARRLLSTTLSEAGLRRRLNSAAVGLLHGVLDEALRPLISGVPCDAPLCQRFAGIYLFDSSIAALPSCLADLYPGCGNQTGTANASVKLLLGFELTGGGLLQLDFFSERDPDQRLAAHRHPLPPGALQISDLGFFGLDNFAQLQRDGVLWLSRAHPQLVRQRDEGNTEPLVAFLSGRGPVVDEWITVGSRKPFGCRVIAWQVPDEVAQRRIRKRQEQQARKQRRRRKVRDRQQKKGRRPRRAGRKVQAPRQPVQELTPNQQEWLHWTVVLTNVPLEKLSPEEAEALLRARWQIEILIKVWKRFGRLERLRGRRPERVACELLAKLLGQLVRHWATLSSVVSYLERNVWEAAKEVQASARQLGAALGQGVEAVRGVWQQLQGQIGVCGRRRRGRKIPSTEQRLRGEDAPWKLREQPRAADEERLQQWCEAARQQDEAAAQRTLASWYEATREEPPEEQSTTLEAWWEAARRGPEKEDLAECFRVMN